MNDYLICSVKVLLVLPSTPLIKEQLCNQASSHQMVKMCNVPSFCLMYFLLSLSHL